jgi:hypothetical protein
MFLRTIRILPLFVSAAVAQGGTDFIVVADPSAYTIYNQYEQPVSENEQGWFFHYSPFQVVEKDITLGDQITHALKFVFQQRMYYLLKDEDGKFIGEKSKSGRQIIRDAEPFGDTIEALAVGLTMVDGEGRNIPITKGMRLARIFRSGPRYYCTAVSDRAVYGWSSLEPRYAWRKLDKSISAGVSALSDTGLSEYLRLRILARFASANEAYKACFSHFNSLRGDEKAVPQWRCERNGGRFVCRLDGSISSNGQLSESSKVLEQDIGNLLMGTDYKAMNVNGEILIEKRNSPE